MRRRNALALVALACAASVLVDAAAAEQASQPTSPAAARLDSGGRHTCAVSAGGSVRCWGFNGDGELGYSAPIAIGDDEAPASIAPVDVGAGRTATAISAGDFHTCALLDDRSVRCWGFGGDGRLGYGSTRAVSDPASAGPVDLGPGRAAKAISAGGAHTCAILDDGSVRCWGYGGGGVPGGGQLGYGDNENVGDDETPGSVEPVDLGRAAVAISVGGAHACAVLDDASVRCWGRNQYGQLGLGHTNNVGDDETPASAPRVRLGRGAVAISAGAGHTCAILNDATVRCWGFGGGGQLGYGNTANVGDTPTTTPASAGPVRLGLGRTARAIAAGRDHTCALLDDASVRCWGIGANGRLGYGDQANVGDVRPPDAVGPVDIGSGAAAISAGLDHTCARLVGGSVRCWGLGEHGRLGLCNEESIGDDETPASVGPVSLEPGDGGATCEAPAAATGAPAAATGAPPTATGAPPAALGDASLAPRSQASGPLPGADAAARERLRAGALRACLSVAARRARRELRRPRRGSGGATTNVRRRIVHRARRARDRCRRIHGRTPGRVDGLRATAAGVHRITLRFRAAGTDDGRPPAARRYVIKQSLRPIRSAREFRAGQALCGGSCSFDVTEVGAVVNLTVDHLLRGRTYYYAIAARDNVSARLGPRAPTVKAPTRRGAVT